MQARVEFRDPPFLRSLFGDPAWAWLWLLIRLYLGAQWIEAGWNKLLDPKWMQSGAALKGFWARAVTVPEGGRPLIVFDWYRDFISFLLNEGHYVWFAKVISVSEFAVGIALVLGVFVGFAAIGGAFLNWNFMMAGSASSNPVLVILALLLVMAWKTAGYIGIDRWLLPALGTPWQPGALFQRRARDGKESQPPEGGGG